MNTIVIRFLSGSKAQRVEKFPLKHVRELIIGSDPAATVNVPDEWETGIDRFHAHIIGDDSNPEQFIISDLESHNGTYVNGERIAVPTILKRGDVIQCGLDGPHIQFYLEPGTEPLIPDISGQIVGSPFIKGNQPRDEIPGTTEDLSAETEPVAVMDDIDDINDGDTEPLEEETIGSGLFRPVVVSILLFGLSSMIVAGIMYFRSGRSAVQEENVSQPVPAATETIADGDQLNLPAAIDDDETQGANSVADVPIPAPTNINNQIDPQAPPSRTRQRPTTTSPLKTALSDNSDRFEALADKEGKKKNKKKDDDKKKDKKDKDKKDKKDKKKDKKKKDDNDKNY